MKKAIVFPRARLPLAGGREVAKTCGMRAVAYLSAANLAAKTAEWWGILSRLPRPGRKMRIAPSRCALVVVDMMRFFVHPSGSSFLPASEVVSPRVLRLLKAFRKAEMPVAITAHCHEANEEDGSLKSFFGRVIPCGSYEAELIPSFRPLETDIFVRKNTYDAFHGTDLEKELRRRGVGQVMVCGVTANLCCETTARSAFVRGFDVFLPMDGVAATHEEYHLATLVNLAAGFARVMDTEEILRESGLGGTD